MCVVLAISRVYHYIPSCLSDVMFIYYYKYKHIKYISFFFKMQSQVDVYVCLSY